MANRIILYVIASLCLVNEILCVIPLKNITFVALFDSDDRVQELAFKAALNAIRMKNAMYPETRFEVVDRNISSNSYTSLKEVCTLIDIGVTAIFGPQSRSKSALVQSITNNLNIAHILIGKDYRWNQQKSSINLHPHPLILGKVYKDLICYFGWTKFAIILDDNEGFINMKDIFSIPNLRSDYGIVVRKLPPDENYLNLLKSVKTLSRRNLIVDCSVNKIYNFLKQAQQLGMVMENYHYIFTSLDLETLQLDEFRRSGVNITALRIVDPSSFVISHVVKSFSKTNKNLTNNYTLSTEVALMIDAVFMSMQAIKPLVENNFTLTRNVSCTVDAEDNVLENNITAYMKQLREYSGLSGLVLLNEDGLRVEFKVDIISITENGTQPFAKIGNWSSIVRDNSIARDFNIPGLMMILPSKSTFSSDGDYDVETNAKRHLNVTTILNDPYVMLKPYWNRQTGNSIYEGFCVDLLDELAKMIGFTYTIQPARDRKYGIRDMETGKWNGMIGELHNGLADLAMADLTMTKERHGVIEFSVPYMHHGLSVMFRKPKFYDATDSYYLSPFSPEVWIYLVVAYMIVSVLLCCFARLSRDEWYNPNPSNNDPKTLQNNFGIQNSFLFTLSTFMQQGYYHKPRSLTTRLIAILWCGFSLVIVCFYVGASFKMFHVHQEAEKLPFTSLTELERSTNKGISYGFIRGGSTHSFFRNTAVSLYQRMWSNMQEMEPSPFVSSYKEGIARVQRGNYAFFIEGPSSEYTIEKNCDLYRVGGLLDYKGYGVALAKGSPYRDAISAGILILQEKGTLELLRKKWWIHRNVRNECPDDDQRIQSSVPLKPIYFRGLFYALFSMLLIATITGMGEFLFRCYQISKEQQEHLGRVIRNQFVAAIKPHNQNTQEEHDSSLVVNEEIIDDIE